MNDGIDYILSAAKILGSIWIVQIAAWLILGWPTLLLFHWLLK